MNLCRVPLGDDGVGRRSAASRSRCRTRCAAADGELIVGLRPESLELAPDGSRPRSRWSRRSAPTRYVFCAADVGGEETRLVARAAARQAPERGARVSLRPVPGEAHLFEPHGGARVA